MNVPNTLYHAYSHYHGANEKFFVQGDGSAFFSGNVGIGTTSPAQALHVNGAIKVGSAATCDASTTGSIRYDTTAPVELQICHNLGTENGSAGYVWRKIDYRVCPTNFLSVESTNNGRVIQFGCIQNITSTGYCSNALSTCRSIGGRLPTLSEFNMARVNFSLTASYWIDASFKEGDTSSCGLSYTTDYPQGDNFGTTQNYRCFLPK